MDSFRLNAWRWKCGIPEIEDEKPILLNYRSLIKSEWDDHFETLMRNRLVLGAIRYGKINAPNKPKYDRVASMIKRLNAYKDSGNMEMLVDVANLCLLEFVECHHPLKHFEAVDDGEHVKTIG